MLTSSTRAIAKQFEAIFPAFVIFLLSMIVYISEKSLTWGGTFIEMIYCYSSSIASFNTGSLYGAIGIAFFISFLLWFCVHGLGSKWSSVSSAFI